MYAYFIGTITEIYNDRIVLENNRIGYNIYMPAGDIESLGTGEEVKIYTYTSVREDAFMLYGFIDRYEMDFFKLLLTVNGVGPKAALNILSGSSVENLQVGIVAQDTKALSKVPGIGTKTAERIILDLKNKISNEDILGGFVSHSNSRAASVDGRIRSEACEALCALGYSSSEAMRALSSLDTDTTDVSELVRLALINI